MRNLQHASDPVFSGIPLADMRDTEGACRSEPSQGDFSLWQIPAAYLKRPCTIKRWDDRLGRDNYLNQLKRYTKEEAIADLILPRSAFTSSPGEAATGSDAPEQNSICITGI